MEPRTPWTWEGFTHSYIHRQLLGMRSSFCESPTVSQSSVVSSLLC